MTSDTTQTPISETIVPNEQPTLFNQGYKLAIVGEAPGEEEVYWHSCLGCFHQFSTSYYDSKQRRHVTTSQCPKCGNYEIKSNPRPFVGTSGKFFWAVAARYGITRDACLVANVCQHRPPENKLSEWPENDIRRMGGRGKLLEDINEFKPNLILLLGNTALQYFHFDKEAGVGNWRGSLFQEVTQYKCLATYHPASVLREYSNNVLLHFDLERARKEAESPTLVLPKREFKVNLTPLDTLIQIQSVIANKPTISIDIEGWVHDMKCLAVATSPTSAFIIPFHRDYWGQWEKPMWQNLTAMLTDPEIPKILQNSLYDLFVLQYSYNIPVRGVIDDTMLLHWERYCELPKSLGFQASIYTKEPYYKEERESETTEELHRYCCKDACVTFEIREKLINEVKVGQQHYAFNMQLLDPVLYMEHKGIRYDEHKAADRLRQLNEKIHKLQYALNRIADYPDKPAIGDWVDICKEAFCTVKSKCFTTYDLMPNCKTSCIDDLQKCLNIFNNVIAPPYLNKYEQGYLSELTSQCLNVDSPKQMAAFLYDTMGLEVQYKKEHGKLTDKVTTDALALLKLYHKTQDPTLKLILQLRGLKERTTTLEAKTDHDDRIRCAYNVVGTETGRFTCYESPTGSGYNLQTVTKKDRDLFQADPGYYMFQCDLSGADSWTVAAHCLALGDSCMWEDLQAGLKEARLVALMYNKVPVHQYSRAELKDLSKQIDDDGWLYFGSKRVVHGTHYGMRGATMSDQILKDSYKLLGEPIYIPPSTCDHLQALYLQRHWGILQWQLKSKNTLREKGSLTSANGHRRVFYDRREDQGTLKKYLADEPQNNTTYASNCALLKLWTDPGNRIVSQAPTNTGNTLNPGREKCLLRIQPLHQVHDAVIGQFRVDETEWARPRIRSYFQNELTIAGIKVTIPFEGRYGESWGKLDKGVI